MAELEKEIPQLRESMLAAMGKVVASHLMDRRLFNFKALAQRTGDFGEEIEAGS